MPRKLTEHGRQYIIEWSAKRNKECTKCYSFRLNKETDADVIAKLDSVNNRADYIRKLILEDLKKQ